MEGLAVIAFKSVMLILYLYLSLALLFQHLVRRWIIFTIAFFALYLIAGAALFGHLPDLRNGDGLGLGIAIPARVVVLLGIATIVGWGLTREEPWNFDQVLGHVLLFMAALTSFVVLSYVLGGGPPVEQLRWLFPGTNR